MVSLYSVLNVTWLHDQLPLAAGLILLLMGKLGEQGWRCSLWMFGWMSRLSPHYLQSISVMNQVLLLLPTHPTDNALCQEAGREIYVSLHTG